MLLPFLFSFIRNESDGTADEKKESDQKSEMGTSSAPFIILSSFMVFFVMIFIVLLVLGKKN